MLDHMVILWLIFWGRALLFSKVAALLYMHTGRIQRFQFLYILANICYFLSSVPRCLPPAFPSFLPFSLLQEREEEGEAACFNLCPLLLLLCPLSWVLCLPLIGSPHFQRGGGFMAELTGIEIWQFLGLWYQLENHPTLLLHPHKACLCTWMPTHVWSISERWRTNLGSVTAELLPSCLSNIECSSLQCALENEK